MSSLHLAAATCALAHRQARFGAGSAVVSKRPASSIDHACESQACQPCPVWNVRHSNSWAHRTLKGGCTFASCNAQVTTKHPGAAALGAGKCQPHGRSNHSPKVSSSPPEACAGSMVAGGRRTSDHSSSLRRKAPTLWTLPPGLRRRRCLSTTPGSEPFLQTKQCRTAGPAAISKVRL